MLLNSIMKESFVRDNLILVLLIKHAPFFHSKQKHFLKRRYYQLKVINLFNASALELFFAPPRWDLRVGIFRGGGKRFFCF